jgi:hypothetical protein
MSCLRPYWIMDIQPNILYLAFVIAGQADLFGRKQYLVHSL